MGVIDVFYKIKALHSLGCSIHLHCFKYGRSEDNTLLSYCSKVTYYKRNTNPINLLKATPYVVASRVNNKLLENLLKDNDPVILEGLHMSRCLPALVLKGKRVFVRAHNIEHNYYSGLSLAETVWWRKIYFALEARKLKKYEGILKNADGIIISFASIELGTLSRTSSVAESTETLGLLIPILFAKSTEFFNMCIFVSSLGKTLRAPSVIIKGLSFFSNVICHT